MKKTYKYDILLNMKNPFVFGKVVKDRNLLCARPKEEKILIDNIESNQNTYVIGERRVGKTSLVSSTLEEMKSKKDYLYITVDFRAVASESDAQRRILQSVLKSANEIKDLQWIGSLFSKLKPVAIPNEEGKVEFTIASMSSSHLDSLSLLETFDYIEKTNKRKKVIVFFDEFPDLLKMESGENVLGKMRSKIQSQDSIPYIFAGSHRGEMRNIFENPNNKYHFYKSASPLPLKRFDKSTIGSFCSSQFNLGNMSLSEDVFSEIFNITNGITGDIYELCHEVWDLSLDNEIISFQTVEKSLKEICDRKNEIYGNIISNMTQVQKKVLRGVVLSKGDKIYTSSFVKEHKLKNRLEVQSVIISLTKDNILYKKDGKDWFYDPFFYNWLKHIYSQSS